MNISTYIKENKNRTQAERKINLSGKRIILKPKKDKQPSQLIQLGKTNRNLILWDTQKNSNLLVCGRAGSGKTQLSYRVIEHCLNFPEKWDLFLLDPQGMEISQTIHQNASKYPKTSSTIEESLEHLIYVESELTRRKEISYSANNQKLDELELPKILLLIDSLQFLMPYEGTSSIEDYEENEMKNKIKSIISKLVRTGGEYGINIMITVQRLDFADNEMIPNFPLRIATSDIQPYISEHVFGNKIVRELPSTINVAYIQNSLNSKDDGFFNTYYTEPILRVRS